MDSPPDSDEDELLELDPLPTSYHDDPDAASSASPPPDAPLLTPTPTQPRPKWLPFLTPPSPHRRLLSLPPSITVLILAPASWTWQRRHTFIRPFRPRLTWRYLLFVCIVLYVFLCLVRRVPLFASPLPAYTGQYAVGVVDVEVPLAEPHRVADTLVRKTGLPAFELETVLFTLFYPAAHDARSSKPQHLWIPRPISLTGEGYAKAAHVDNFLMRPLFTFALWAIGGSIRIPAKVDVPLLPAADTLLVGAADGDAEKPFPDAVAKFPVIVFSHGSASTRTQYSHYLGELASRGHIVAALEHRDGSCPGSIVKHPRSASRKDRKVLLMREKDLESDPPMNDTLLKYQQLAFRDAEILEAINVLHTIDAGQGDDVFANNARSEGTHLASWRHRLDFSRLVIAGHSYGATGTLQALKSPVTSPAAAGGIILDPGKSSGRLNTNITTPLLIVHSDSWSRTVSPFFGRPHFETVRDLAQSVLQRVGSTWFLTSLGTSHPSVTDAPLLEPLLLSWTTGARMNVKEGLEEYVKVSLEFLKYLRDGDVDEEEEDGLLREAVTHEEYGKWVSKERKKEFSKKLARLWEIHVSPETK